MKRLRKTIIAILISGLMLTACNLLPGEILNDIKGILTSYETTGEVTRIVEVTRVVEITVVVTQTYTPTIESTTTPTVTPMPVTPQEPVPNHPFIVTKLPP